MKAFLTLALGILFSISSWSSTSSSASDAEAVAESLAKWEKARKACGGNYQYEIAFSSFTGAGNVTTIVVRNNEVSERHYREFGGAQLGGAQPGPAAPGGKPPKEDGPKWIEKGEEVGKHQEGAPAKTLDELYTVAKAVAARELAATEKRYLRFDEDGLLLSCFVVDTLIADDAPRNGVALAKLELETGGEKVYHSPNGKAFPTHWGAPPKLQTRDYRPLPGGYGHGSGTLAKWITENLEKDAENP